MIDKHFVLPKSNRGFNPSVFVNSLVLMQHEGGIRLDDLKHIQKDHALKKLLGLKNIPNPDSVGNWLRRMGTKGVEAISVINQELCRIGLKDCKDITLDIDASEIIGNKTEAKKTYKFNKGYMPMIGHIAETNQVIEVDFREGNTAPKTENLEFIKKCERNLPPGIKLARLRIDCAGYQKSIIQYCDENQVHFAIRAMMSQKIKDYYTGLGEEQWDEVLDQQGKPTGMFSHRTTHTIADYEKPFTLIIQRTSKSGQGQLDIDCDTDEIQANGYIYRAIATSLDSLSDGEIIQWYNARAEKSENKIKELMLDFGGAHTPCGNFNANALYFSICTLSYNLFVLLKEVLPKQFSKNRAKAIRLKIYAMAAKLITHSRQYTLKLQNINRNLLAIILSKIKNHQFHPTLE